MATRLEKSQWSKALGVPAKQKAPRRRLEHLQQVEFFDWASKHVEQYPDLEWAFAVPNGGLRHIRIALDMKAEGAKPGVPDIVIPVARGGHFGLFIENKVRPNRTSPEQNRYIEALRERGYMVVVAYTLEEMQEITATYLSWSRTERNSEDAH